MFRLATTPDTPQSQQFIADGRRILSAIPVVQEFNAYRQVSSKTPQYDFYFTMIFANADDYNTYNNHPDHVGFVKERWMKEVVAFQEADFVAV